ncbi:unnamed protein product [Prorocentrum cordatum]|uniref:Uncharacterized protein n=1 Tax=Prorocentrum cordatum TaxID=2364126 RepID=A0ABN9TI77_9DINO|nr:unnamed protein product [Polarella glacialis]
MACLGELRLSKTTCSRRPPTKLHGAGQEARRKTAELTRCHARGRSTIGEEEEEEEWQRLGRRTRRTSSRLAPAAGSAGGQSETIERRRVAHGRDSLPPSPDTAPPVTSRRGSWQGCCKPSNAPSIVPRVAHHGAHPLSEVLHGFQGWPGGPSSPLGAS